MPSLKCKQTRPLQSLQKQYVRLRPEMMDSSVVLTSSNSEERKKSVYNINSASLTKVTLSK